jgi:hypothetical protein
MGVCCNRCTANQASCTLFQNTQAVRMTAARIEGLSEVSSALGAAAAAAAACEQC